MKTSAFIALIAIATLLDTCLADNSTASLSDASDGRDWAGYGRTFGEQHYSPLTELNTHTVGRLGLAWSLDLGPENSVTQPIAVNGVVYFATGYSVVHAVDASNGRLLWTFDPEAASEAGSNLRFGWGSRGIAWWNHKIYTGTQDGRLIAIDEKAGFPLWSVQTFPKDSAAYITGAPRAFGGKVIIGHSGDTGTNRGYVTAYNTEDGKLAWRFYSVPGNPANGFESPAMEAAAQTWAGDWWKFGGGGDIWNAVSYDPETDTVYVGTGNGYPINRRVRSADLGDNLFVASIIALDGTTGRYKWHYQLNPGDTWDYDATTDMELATLRLGGQVRRVLLQAAKNGFIYVINRDNGKLISAAPYTKVTWAKRIAIETGRPVENARARYPNSDSVEIWPGPFGAHGWLPMSYSPRTHLVYVPVIEAGMMLDDKGITPSNWKPPSDRSIDGAINASESARLRRRGALIAWNPATQRLVWRVPQRSSVVGGVMTTAGGLVFQASVDGTFNAYSDLTGKRLWSHALGAPSIAPPISYFVNGRQYITVLTGLGTDAARLFAVKLDQDEVDPCSGVDPRTQSRRVLTFALDTKDQSAFNTAAAAPVVDDSKAQMYSDNAAAGLTNYDLHCAHCHGLSAVGIIHAPDLRRSEVPLSAKAFSSVVRNGSLVSEGMPGFGELSDQQLDSLRIYIAKQAAAFRAHCQHPATAAP